MAFNPKKVPYPRDLSRAIEDIETFRFEAVDDPIGTIICFAGRGGDYAKGGGWGPFQFAGTLSGGDFNVLYIRDPAEGWFQRGIVGLGDRLEDIAQSIKKILSPYKGLPRVTLGYSMGGYAAILLGTMIGARKAIALSPQSFIDPDMRAEHGDDRWQQSLRKIKPNRMQVPDLLPIMQKNKGMAVSVFYCAKDVLDSLHAKRMENSPHTLIYPVDGDDHNVARALKQQGLLRTVIEQEVLNRTLPPPFTEDSSPTWRFDAMEGSKKCIVVIGSRGRGFGAFEFTNTFKQQPCNILYVRDPGDSWYQNPIRDIGANPDETVAFIREKLEAHGIKETFLVGGSMGGYAALLFGCLLNAKRVLAFAPQTFISPELREQHGDDRWGENMRRIETIHYGDLLPLMERSSCEAVIHYSKDVAIDALHAERLAHLPQITLHGHESPLHNIARVMQKRRQFNPALADAMELPADMWEAAA